MKLSIKFASLVLLLALVFVPMHSAAAKGLLSGKIILGQSFTLKSGDTLDGDLVVLGGSATIEQGAKVDGNVVVTGGSLVVDGEITGDVAVIGGSVTLGVTSYLHGNLSTVGATLDRAGGSRVDGSISNTATSWIVDGSNGSHPVPLIVNPPIPILPELDFGFNLLGSVANVIGQAIAFGILAMLVVMFMATHTERVANAITAQPLVAGGIGLLILVLTPLALILLTITIILIPVTIIVVLGLIVAGVFGWVAIGLEIGQRFTRAIHQEWHPALAAGLGTFTLTLVANAVTAIPILNCVGWLIPFLLVLAALGGVIMTRFGMQSVAASTNTTAIAPMTPTAPIMPEAPAEPTAPPRKSKTK